MNTSSAIRKIRKYRDLPIGRVVQVATNSCYAKLTPRTYAYLSKSPGHSLPDLLNTFGLSDGFESREPLPGTKRKLLPKSALTTHFARTLHGKYPLWILESRLSSRRSFHLRAGKTISVTLRELNTLFLALAQHYGYATPAPQLRGPLPVFSKKKMESELTRLSLRGAHFHYCPPGPALAKHNGVLTRVVNVRRVFASYPDSSRLVATTLRGGKSTCIPYAELDFDTPQPKGLCVIRGMGGYAYPDGAVQVGCTLIPPQAAKLLWREVGKALNYEITE